MDIYIFLENFFKIIRSGFYFWGAIICFLLLWMFGKCIKQPNDEKQKIRLYSLRMVILSLIIIIFYFMVASALDKQSFFFSNGSAIFKVAMLIAGISMSSTAIKNFYREVLSFSWKSKKYYNQISFWVIIFCLFVMLLMASSFFNYVLFNFYSDGFKDANALLEDSFALAFEIIYYTFSLIITYSGNPVIEPANVLTKIVQMIEILVFYVSFGCIFTTLLSEDASETVN